MLASPFLAMLVTALAWPLLKVAYAINEPDSKDLFYYPPEPSAAGSDMLAYHEQDVLNLNWQTSVGNTNLEYLCCTPTLCTILFALNNVTGINNGYWVLNFTLSYGTGDNCYMRIDQPLRGDFIRFESEHFMVSDFTGQSTLWGSSGSQPLAPTGEQSTNGSFLSPPLSLSSDGDASQVPDRCLSLNSVYEQDCWAALGLSEWVPAWVTANVPCAANASCQTTGTDVPPWTQSFLASSGWGPQRGCWHLGFDACEPSSYTPPVPPASVSRPDRLLFSRYAYVSYTIYSIWEFFTSWGTAMDNAIIRAAGDISHITAVVDSTTNAKHNWAKDVIVTALGVVVAAIPGVGPEASLALALAVKAGTAAAGQAPAAVSYLWSRGSQSPADTREIQNDQLQALLDGPTGTSVRSILDRNINTTLAILQGVEKDNTTDDFSNFIKFTSQGHYSDSGNKITVDADSDATYSTLTSTFNTYLISSSLAQNGFYAVLLPGLDPVAVYNDPASNCPTWAGSSCNSKSRDVGCGGQLDEYGLCGNMWYSAAHKSSYLLLKDGKTNIKQSAQILQNMNTSGYATGNSLFEGAAICELQIVFPNISSPSYTASGVNGLAGFYFAQGSFPAAGQYASPVNSTTNFLAIGQEGFAQLSQEDALASSWIHPSNTLFSSSPGGFLTTDCIAQLNLSVANSWGGKKVDSWTQKRPK